MAHEAERLLRSVAESQPTAQTWHQLAEFYRRKYREASKHHHKRALVLTARKGVGLIVGLLHRNEAYRPKEV